MQGRFEFRQVSHIAKVDEDVLWLEVAVSDPMGMHVLKTAEQLAEDAPHLRMRAWGE